MSVFLGRLYAVWRKEILTITRLPGFILSSRAYGQYMVNPPLIPPPTNKKNMLQRVSRLTPVGFSAPFNLLKVCQRWTPEKYFSRWRPRWPEKPLNGPCGHKSVTIN